MKHLFSLHQKIKHKQISFDEIYDIVAFRLIVEDTPACYHALGVIHSLYRPIPGRFKDYIALPKPNGYQSLHTSIMGPENHRIEVQIRTKAMHQYAEDGIAAHALYKNTQANGQPSEQERRSLLWLKQLTELLQKAQNPSEFMESVRLDLFVQEVYVFSRDGDIFALPRGARPLDFAYAIHTDLGNRCIGARINGAIVDLQTKLHNGDQIEILSSPDQEPSLKWLQYVKTSKARQAIRHYYRRQDAKTSKRMGEKILHEMLPNKASTALIQSLQCKSLEELEMKLGAGDISIDTLLQTMNTTQKLRLSLEPMHMHYGADCCHPIPGDAVLGHMVKGQGMELHYKDCPHALTAEADHWLQINWHDESERLHPTAIEVHTEDLRGMLSKVSGCISQSDANIQDLNLEQRAGEMTRIHILVAVRDRLHLARVLRELRMLPGVLKVKRKNHRELTQHRSYGFGDVVLGMVAKGRRSLLKSTEKLRGKS